MQGSKRAACLRNAAVRVRASREVQPNKGATTIPTRKPPVAITFAAVGRKVFRLVLTRFAQDDRVREVSRQISRTRSEHSPVSKVLLIALALSLACHASGWAHVPVPDSVLNPRSGAEAWNVLRLATANTERLIKENRLAEIPDQISLCNPALRTLPGFAKTPEERDKIKAGAVRASVTINSLAQGSIAGDREFVGRALTLLQGNLHDLAASFDPATVDADVFVCPMHPDVTSTDPQARCEKCGMPLVMRRIPYSFVYTPPGEPTLRLTARAQPLQEGQEARVTVHLAHGDGSPVRSNELTVVHTQPIHLLIVDAGLVDYHHEHPSPTGVSGDYAFSFVPAKTGRYRVFADLVPTETSAQEYPFVDLTGAAASDGRVDDRQPTLEAEAGGLRFRLQWSGGERVQPKMGQAQELRIAVAKVDGTPMNQLEPVMGAFAHLVGFYEDGRTVLHVHPLGEAAMDPNLRGGPTLVFKVFPPKAGFLRLFCQVQVAGKAIYAPFSVNVTP